jgi:SAM-dependent methyltransferase
VAFQDHFSSRASLYARARPDYPASLFADLAERAPTRTQAWDCGTGSGQAASGLAAHFASVVATDPSAAQLGQAVPNPRIRYREAAEDDTGLAAGSTDLITVAQAAHWLDLTRFAAEATRVLRPGGIVAFWCYGLCTISPEIDPIVGHFYHDTVGAYWPPERRHVEDGYRSLEFPFPESPFPVHRMERHWTLGEFAAYIRSWSAVDRYHRERGADPVDALTADLAPVWGIGARTIHWPLGGRLGRRA